MFGGTIVIIIGIAKPSGMVWSLATRVHAPPVQAFLVNYLHPITSLSIIAEYNYKIT